MIVVVLVGGTVLALFVWGFAIRPVAAWEAINWARSVRLQLSDRTLPDVRRYLTRQRRFVGLGLAIGLAASFLLDRWSQASPGSLIVVFLWPYAVASVLAGLLHRPPPAAGAADLEPRTVDRYLHPAVVWIPRALLVVVLAADAWSLVAARPAPPGTSADGRLFAYAAVAVAVLGLGEAAQRVVLGRRRPIGPFDVVAADDAIRTHAAHSIGGTVLMSLIALLAPAGERLAGADVLPTVTGAIGEHAPLVAWYVGILGMAHGTVVRPLRPVAPPPPPAGPPPPVGPPLPGPPPAVEVGTGS